MKPLYQILANKLAAYHNCLAVNNTEWANKHEDKIEELVKEYMPSGSGFDNGTIFDFENSTGEKLVFNTSFHHMNNNGFYDGWTEHKVIVRPSLMHGFTLRITGRNKREIKQYIHECFHTSFKEI